MPTYSYRCTECATAFDIQQAFTDDSLTVCPDVRRQAAQAVHAVGVSFNGSGFYRNDSRAAEKKAREKKDARRKPSRAESKETAAARFSRERRSAAAKAAPPRRRTPPPRKERPCSRVSASSFSAAT